MAVEVQHQADDHTRATLSISVSPEEIAAAKDKAFGQYTRRLTVPGFRPGKAPRQMIEKWIDQKQLIEMALERVINDSYQAAIRETGLHPYQNAEAKFELPDEEIKPEEGFTYTVALALEPHVHLGPLEGLTARKVQTTVTEDEITREIERLREQLVHWHQNDEAEAKIGDRVRLTAQISMDGALVDEASIDEPTVVELGANFETFDQALEGIKAGEERAFEFTYPEDFADEELRNKTATATVKAYEVHTRHVYNEEEFAEKVGHESVEKLRETMREAMQRQADAVAEQELQEDLIKQALKVSHVHYPDEMVEFEASASLSNLIAQLEARSLTLDDYLRSRQTDIKSLEEAIRSESRERIERTLVLLEVARENDLGLTEKEVEAELKRRADVEGVKLSQIRRYLNDNNEMQSVRDRLFYDKVGGFLRSKAEIVEVTG